MSTACHRAIRLPAVSAAIEAAAQLEERYPGLKSRMTEAGKLRRGPAAFVNDQSPNAGLQTTVAPEAETYFAPAIAGRSALEVVYYGRGADDVTGSGTASD